MSRVFAGFVKGFSDTALDSLQLREQEEAEKRKAKMLDQLRRDTAKYELELRESFEARRVDNNLTETDYDSGQRILRNSSGAEIGRTTIPKHEQVDRQISLDAARLGLEDKRSQIDSRARDDVRQDRYTNAAIENMKDQNVDEKNVAVDQYNRVFKELAEIVNPAELAKARQTFWRNVNEGKSKQWQRGYLDEYYQYAVRKNPTDPKRRPLAETHPASTSALFNLED